MQVRQFDRVGDRLDLRVESPDVGVGDVGHLFEDELLGLLAHQLLDEQVRAQVEQQRVATAQLDVAQRVGELDDPLLVGAAVDEDAALVEHFLDGDHLTLSVGVAHADDGEGLVQDDLVAPLDLSRVEARVQRDAHLASRGEDVDGAVVVEVDERAVDRGRLGQFLDLVAQRGDLVARLLDRDRQFLVVRTCLGQLRLEPRAASPRASRCGDWPGRRRSRSSRAAN